jgi:hypothetical protein
MNSSEDVPAYEPKYEEHFTAFVDLLGFSEASAEVDDETRSQVLELLQSLSGLQQDFSAITEQLPTGGTRHQVRPSISSFSDNIVISFPLEPITSQTSPIEVVIILGQFERLVAMLAAEALKLGPLVRGGATIGKLYHAQGVIFGEALGEAYELEKRTAIFPRVVFSNSVVNQWAKSNYGMFRDSDGLYCANYI